jgi:hypothetical protein
MYFLMVSSSSLTGLTQYPRLQKCSLVTFLLPMICRWILTAPFPLLNPLANATLSFGEILTLMWIWSGIRCPSSRPIPHCQDTSRITSSTSFLGFQYSFLFRYFSMMTIWECDSRMKMTVAFSLSERQEEESATEDEGSQ